MANCPSCKQPLKKTEVADIVICTNCGKKFKTQKPAFDSDASKERWRTPQEEIDMSPPAPPIPPTPPPPNYSDNFPQPEQEPQPEPVVSRTPLSVSRMLAQRHQPKGFIEFVFALFDFTFKHYLTPIIIRVYWIGTLIIAGLSLIGAFIILVFSLLPEPVQEELQKSQPRSEFRLAGVPEIQVIRFAESSMMKVTVFVAQVIATIIGLLAIRVFCEVLIVVFNIASTLVSMENKLEAVG